MSGRPATDRSESGVVSRASALPAGTATYHGFLQQLDGLERVVVDREHDERHVQPRRRDEAQQLAVVALLVHVDVDRGARVTQAPERAREDRGACRERAGADHGAAGAAGRELRVRRVEVGDHAGRVASDDLAGRRQLDAARSPPVDEQAANALLELRDLMADGRLRQVQPCGRALERALDADGVQGDQMSQLDAWQATAAVGRLVVRAARHRRDATTCRRGLR